MGFNWQGQHLIWSLRGKHKWDELAADLDNCEITQVDVHISNSKAENFLITKVVLDFCDEGVRQVEQGWICPPKRGLYTPPIRGRSASSDISSDISLSTLYIPPHHR